MRYLLITILAIFTAACATQEGSTFRQADSGTIDIQNGQVIALSADFQSTVPFHGIFTYDDMQTATSGPLYPGGTAEVFLASVITHAIIANTIKNKSKSDIRNKYDYVLAPYEAQLQEVTHGYLIDEAISNLRTRSDLRIIRHGDDVASTHWELTSKPAFFMTQDEREIVLRHAIFIKDQGANSEVFYKNIIEISSFPITTNHPETYWNQDQKLTLTSMQLYVTSLSMLLDELSTKQSNETAQPQRTFRYIQGGEKQYERGSLISNTCERTTIRTLRGWLKSFPRYEESLPVNEGKSEGSTCETGFSEDVHQANELVAP